MLKEYFKAFEKDRDFKSRTGKDEFWRAALPDFIILGALIAGFFCLKSFDIVFLALGIAYVAVTFTSRLALWTRRLHDTGIKGTFVFVILVPILGFLALLFVFMSDSQQKDNGFGKFTKDTKKKRK
ncbi:MAG: DUF805 domain-containing protein [Clostridia bacterium]|nr:DUF805 domain-containing protein [Clostridia bacterium]